MCAAETAAQHTGRSRDVEAGAAECLFDLSLLQARFEDVGHSGEAELAEGEFDEIHDGVSCSAIVEMAEPARLAAASRARVFGGVRAGRS